MQCFKAIKITVEPAYPIISCYEFEFLKKEKVVKDILKDATLYMIIQRPLVTFDDVCFCEDEITANISDKKTSIPVIIRPFKLNHEETHERLEISTQFFSDKQDAPPFQNIPAFKIHKENGDFLHLITPQKSIYEYQNGSELFEFGDNPLKLQKYKIHYIGQAFSQPIWNRLTGHEKLQSTLTKEDTISKVINKNAYEICLLLLKITKFEEQILCAGDASELSLEYTPVTTDIEDEDEFVKYNEPWISLGEKPLTAESEAFLVNLFKPEYNEKQFDKYPKIDKGMLSAGYSHSEIEIKGPVVLFTDYAHTETDILNIDEDGKFSLEVLK